jgi:hypothetical protein
LNRTLEIAMTTQALLSFHSTTLHAVRAGATPRRDCLDFAGRSVHLDVAAIGPVVGWYFGTKPRRDATVIAVGRRAWHAGSPDAEIQAHAAALIERGESVLLVDLRRSQRPWSAWIGCTRARVVEAALGYLEDRGYDVQAARVIHAD